MRIAMRIVSLVLPLIFLCASSVLAVAQEVTFGAQVRPRTEYRDPVGGGDDAFTSMRVRAHLNAALKQNVRVFVQVQDVRIWGEESSTLGDFDADNFDLHQGFIELGSSNDHLMARIGRQEMNLGGQRLVGAVDWTQQGRSFDGARARAGGPWGGITLFGYQLADATSPDIDDDALFLGAHGEIKNVAGGTLGLYALYDHADVTLANTNQGTLGARLAGTASGVVYRGELYFQTGDRGGADVEAFMVGARVGTQFAGGKGRVTAWYDYLSGDDDPTDNTTKVFATLFATNHKFYGFADLFLNIPAHTAGLGLQDLALKGSYAVRNDLTVAADLHTFHVAKQGLLTTKHLGEELDLTGRFRYSPNVTFVGGLSYVFAADGFAEIGRLSEDMTWLYIMLNASF
jgi:hypothetical protein